MNIHMYVRVCACVCEHSHTTGCSGGQMTNYWNRVFFLTPHPFPLFHFCGSREKVTCAMACVKRTKDNTRESLSFLVPRWFLAWTQVVRLGGARSHLRSILPSLSFHLYVDSGASNSGCQTAEQAPSPESNLDVSSHGRKDRSLVSSY